MKYRSSQAEKIEILLNNRRQIRVIGFDDAPFSRQQTEPVAVAGVVCAGTRFEGLLWGQIAIDGFDSTDTLIRMLQNSKFKPQLHLVLLDGIGMGGLNLIDISHLSQEVKLPCVAVMRKFPNLEKMKEVIARSREPEARLAILAKAGQIYSQPPFYFQVVGLPPSLTLRVLQHLTDCGHVPEALRLAHLITAGVIKGESGKQA